MAELWGVVIVGWFCSAIVGGVIGAGRNSAGAGFVLGLLFGPLGAIAAFALDGRVRCPQCGNRIDTEVSVCPACRADLAWLNGVVGTQSQVRLWIIRQQQERADAARVERERAEDAARQSEEFNRRLGVAARWLWAAMIATAHAVVIVPIATVDRWLYGLADGARGVYRALQVIWYLIIPTVVVGGLSMVSAVTRQQMPPAAREEVVEPVPDAAAPPPGVAPARAAVGDDRASRAVEPPVAIAPQPKAHQEPPVIPEALAQDEAPPVREPVNPFADGVDLPVMDEPDGQDPAPVAEAVAPRPVVVDGAEMAARAAQAKAKEDRQRRISEIEREIERLSKERRAVQDEARVRAARDVQGGLFFGESPAEAQARYKVNQEEYADKADVLLEKMRSLREEMNELKREIARERRQ